MAREELKWRSYQDKQLNILKSLETSFEKSLRTSNTLERSLSKVEDALSSVTKSLKAVADYMGGSSSLNSFSANTARISNSARDMEKASRQYVHTVSESQKILLDGGRTVIDVSAKMQEAARIEMELAEAMKQKVKDLEVDRTPGILAAEDYLSRLKDKQEKDKEDFKYTIKNLTSKISGWVAEFDRVAEEYTTLSNNLIRTSGATGELVRGSRGEIVHDVINQLNRDTGNYYNAKESYSTMVSLSEQIGIGNMETLKELTRPLLLAAESTDIQLGDLGSLLTKWNTRYNFSSMDMEHMVNEIRSNTAGNQSTAQATMENINKLQTWMQYYAKGDTDMLNQMTSEISQYTSWLESMGMDTARYTEMMSKIASGDHAGDVQLLQILNRAGVSWDKSQDMFSSGNISGIAQALLQGESSLINELTGKDIRLLGPTAEAMSMNAEELAEIYSVYNSANFKSFEEFMSGVDKRTATEAVEDKYIDIGTKITNKIDQILEHLASAHEIFEISSGNLVGLVTSITSVIGTVTLISKASGGISGILSGIGSVLGTSGGAAGVGGTIASVAARGLPIVAGVSAIVGLADSIFDTVSHIRDENKEMSTELINATKGLKEDKVAMLQEIISVDSEGNVVKSYSTELVDPSTYDPQKHLENIEKARQQDLKQYRPEGFLNTALSGIFGHDFKQWYDYIPIIGALGQGIYDQAGSYNTNKKYDTMSKYTNFINGLSEDDRLLASAYASSGLMTNEDQMKFLMKNWSTLKDLHSKGLAVQLSKDGLSNPMNSMELIGYNQGTNYIPYDQVAVIHEGEAVVPKKYNPMANLTELEMLREQSKHNQEMSYAESQKSQQYLRETLATLSDIREFLAEWKEDNIRRESISEQRKRFSSNSNFVANYMTT